MKYFNNYSFPKYLECVKTKINPGRMSRNINTLVDCINGILKTKGSFYIQLSAEDLDAIERLKKEHDRFCELEDKQKPYDKDPTGVKIMENAVDAVRLQMQKDRVAVIEKKNDIERRINAESNIPAPGSKEPVHTLSLDTKVKMENGKPLSISDALNYNKLEELKKRAGAGVKFNEPEKHLTVEDKKRAAEEMLKGIL